MRYVRAYHSKPENDLLKHPDLYDVIKPGGVEPKELGSTAIFMEIGAKPCGFKFPEEQILMGTAAHPFRNALSAARPDFLLNVRCPRLPAVR